MVEVLSFWHAGVHCAVPSKRVVRIGLREPHPSITLWDEVCGSTPTEGGRSLGVESPHGLMWLEVTSPVICLLDPRQLFPVSAALRAFLPLRYVVGLGELKGELVWLVDSRRLPKELMRGASRNVGMVEESDTGRGV